jgi:hypothetical protein
MNDFNIMLYIIMAVFVLVSIMIFIYKFSDVCFHVDTIEIQETTGTFKNVGLCTITKYKCCDCDKTFVIAKSSSGQTEELDLDWANKILFKSK